MQTLVRGGTIVTCARSDARPNTTGGTEKPSFSGESEDAGLVGDVLFEGDRILAVGDVSAQLRTPARVIDASGCAVIPGFVQAHVHLCQALFRGMADDLPLLEWLKARIWPLEAAHDPKSLTASAELGLAEMMRAGTTTILDMGTVHDHDVVMEACIASGIRAVSGKTMMDAGEGVPNGLRETTKSSLDESEALAKRWAGKGNGRIGYAYAPRFILSCSEALVRGAVDRAKSDGSLVHTHAAEHPGEREAVRAILGDDDIDILRKWGVSGARAILAHGVQLTDDEARALAAEGTRIVHCPSANLKLGSGIARIAELDAFGVQLALGADGAPCNNNLDPFTELRHAALLAKVRTGVTTLPARRALRLATIDGAIALGMGDRTGSIEVGKQADLVVVRLDGLHAEPGGDVYTKLVYACGSRDVVHVFVAGTHVVKHAEHTLLDEARVASTAREQAKKLVARAF